MMQQAQCGDFQSGELFLRCVYEYLCDHGVTAAVLYGGHIQILRATHELNVAFTSEMVVTVEVSEFQAGTSQTINGMYQPSEQIVVEEKGFDIGDPNSLQGIHEFVMSKNE